MKQENSMGFFFCASKCYLLYLRHFVFCKSTFQSIDHPAKLVLWKMMPHVERSDFQLQIQKNIIQETSGAPRWNHGRCRQRFQILADFGLRFWEWVWRSIAWNMGSYQLLVIIFIHEKVKTHSKITIFLCLDFPERFLQRRFLPFLGGMRHIKRIEWKYIPEFRCDASFQKGSPFPAGHFQVPCWTLGAYVTQKN